MSYDLQFLPSALKEWEKLGSTLKTQFKKKLSERLNTPHVHADALHGMPNHYKIKLRSAGYRLVYRVEDSTITVTVVAVGKRERNAVYKAAQTRTDT
jgi:mRNA interferase RelE/StbE